MKIRFRDIISLDISRWILDPYQILDPSTDMSIDIELIELKNDFR